MSLSTSASHCVSWARSLTVSLSAECGSLWLCVHVPVSASASMSPCFCIWLSPPPQGLGNTLGLEPLNFWPCWFEPCGPQGKMGPNSTAPGPSCYLVKPRGGPGQHRPGPHSAPGSIGPAPLQVTLS